MKIRSNYVSNSSSSSFICDFCGREECGYDLSLSDCYMKRCENGHIYCESEELTGFEKSSIKNFKKYLERNKNEWEVKYFLERERTKNFLEELNKKEDGNIEELEYFEEVEDDINDIFYENEYEEVCPLCQCVRVTDKDALHYLLKKYNLKMDELIEMMKESKKNENQD